MVHSRQKFQTITSARGIDISVRSAGGAAQIDTGSITPKSNRSGQSIGVDVKNWPRRMRRHIHPPTTSAIAGPSAHGGNCRENNSTGPATARRTSSTANVIDNETAGAAYSLLESAPIAGHRSTRPHVAGNDATPHHTHDWRSPSANLSSPMSQAVPRLYANRMAGECGTTDSHGLTIWRPHPAKDPGRETKVLLMKIRFRTPPIAHSSSRAPSGPASRPSMVSYAPSSMVELSSYVVSGWRLALSVF